MDTPEKHISTLEMIMPKGWLDSEYPDKKPEEFKEPKIRRPILERLGIRKSKQE